MNVSWTSNSSNAAGFKIERSADGLNFIQVGTVAANVTTFEDTGLSNGTAYYYRVCAFDQDYGNSAYSNVVSPGAQAFDLYWDGGAGSWTAAASGSTRTTRPWPGATDSWPSSMASPAAR